MVLNSVKFLFKRKPTYLIWHTTLHCNARCKHCFNIENLKRPGESTNDLTLEELELICKGYGHVKYLTLSGGEPSIRKDLAQAISLFYKYNNLHYLNFITNGIATQDIVHQISSILQLCPNLFVNVTVSIDDIGHAHDKVRNAKGCFLGLTKTINELKKIATKYRNLEITSNSTLSEINMLTIFNTHNYIVNKLNIPHKIILHRKKQNELQTNRKLIEIYEKIAYLSEKDYDRFYKSNDKLYSLFRFRRIIDYYRIIYLIKILKDRKKYLNCFAGKTMLVLLNNGDIVFCEPLIGKKIGNLRDYNYIIRNLLTSQKAINLLREIKKNNCFCDWDCVIKNNLVFEKKLYFKYLLRFFARIMHRNIFPIL